MFECINFFALGELFTTVQFFFFFVVLFCAKSSAIHNFSLCACTSHVATVCGTAKVATCQFLFRILFSHLIHLRIVCVWLRKFAFFPCFFGKYDLTNFFNKNKQTKNGTTSAKRMQQISKYLVALNAITVGGQNIPEIVVINKQNKKN